MRQIVYVLIVAVASPVLIVGYLLLMLRGWGEMRRSGLSVTAANAQIGRAHV